MIEFFVTLFCHCLKIGLRTCYNDRRLIGLSIHIISKRNSIFGYGYYYVIRGFNMNGVPSESALLLCATQKRSWKSLWNPEVFVSKLDQLQENRAAVMHCVFGAGFHKCRLI